MAKDVKDLFKHFFAIRDSSIENSLFISISFLIVIFGLLICSFLNSFHILNVSPMLDVGLVKLFSQSAGSHFVPLTVSFALLKLFSFMRSH